MNAQRMQKGATEEEFASTNLEPTAVSVIKDLEEDIVNLKISVPTCPVRMEGAAILGLTATGVIAHLSFEEHHAKLQQLKEYAMKIVPVRTMVYAPGRANVFVEEDGQAFTVKQIMMSVLVAHKTVGTMQFVSIDMELMNVNVKKDSLEDTVNKKTVVSQTRVRMEHLV